MKTVLLVCGIIVIIAGFFIPDKAFTINIHDTYLVIGLSPIGFVLVFMALILMLISKIKRVVMK